MEYYSDASLSASDSEDEEVDEEMYCPRELDYWEIEKLLDSRGPPPVIEYLSEIGVFALREMVLARAIPIESVACPSVVHSWTRFWRGLHIDEFSLFSKEDWNAIGEFCLALCSCVVPNPSANHVRSCMIQSLKYGNFRKLKVK
jgi:hypothetical protein